MTDYIFIHINKCGGHSVKQAFDWPTPWQQHQHERIGCVKDRMRKDVFRDLFKFAVIRHPFDRIQSMYYYRKRYQRRKALAGMDFDEWFYKAFTEEFSPRPLHNRPCFDWITIDGELAVDYVARLENIEDDWQVIQDRLGIDRDLPKENSQKYEPVTFTPDMKRMVKDKFNQDFELYESRRYRACEETIR